MDKGAWWTTLLGVEKLDTTDQPALSFFFFFFDVQTTCLLLQNFCIIWLPMHLRIVLSGLMDRVDIAECEKKDSC